MKPEAVIPRAQAIVNENGHLLVPENWEGLSSNDRRKALFVETMMRVLTKQFDPRSHYHDDFNDGANGMYQLQDIIRDGVKTCEVCQRGMIVLAAVSLKNNCTVKDYQNLDIVELERMLGIEEYIPRAELELMEDYFESNKGDSEFKDKYHWAISEASKKTLSLAICLNALEFGKFTPEKYFD